MPEYPKEAFPGTPKVGIWVIRRAMEEAAVAPGKWEIPLQVIARYESGWNPYVQPGICKECRGLMQQSVAQYKAHWESFLWWKGADEALDVEDPVLAVTVAIRYIKGDLPGFGGYGNIGPLLKRDDRGPGEVLRKWVENPGWGVAKLRPYYHGY